MNFIDILKQSAKKRESIVCLGLDPVIEKIPVSTTSVEEKIYLFYEEILNEIEKRKIYPSAIKPNYAFYAQYGFEGLHALQRIITLYKKADLPVILDVKRGDIGTTAAAYAKEAYEFFDADAVTLSPYMGYDSIRPFTEGYPEKGTYILCKTSNKSSGDIQNIKAHNTNLYMMVAKKIIEWHSPGLGAVTGATYPEELDEILSLFYDARKEIPLLIPGIGSQGGDLAKIISILQQKSDLHIHRINSSSAINYAYLARNTSNFSLAAVDALSELNTSISRLIYD